MKVILVVVCLISLLLAGDVFADKPKLDACVGCHGLDGRSRDPATPNLAGQKRLYLIKALKDFRIGSRQHLMMNFVAKEMDDDDIDNYATYYSEFQ